MWSKNSLIEIGKRILFSLLAVWVHFASFFVISMVLFSRGNSGDKADQTSPHHEKIIQVSLRHEVAAPPVPLPLPVEKPDANPEPVPPPVEPAKEEARSAPQVANSDGVLNCDALTKKPKLIVTGEAFMQLKNIDSTAGSITLSEKIGRDGRVIEVIVEKSTMSRYMEEEVVNSARHAIFAPGELGGVGVDCHLRFEVSVGSPENN